MRFLLILALSALTLASCGFQPVYSDRNTVAIAPDSDLPARTATVAAALNTVSVGNIPDKAGQDLRNMLLDQLYTPGAKGQTMYELTFSNIGERRRSLGIDKDASVTRSQLELATTMTLRERATGKALMSRNLRAVSSFNVLGSQFTTLVTRQDARQQALQELANNAVNALELYFVSQN